MLNFRLAGGNNPGRRLRFKGAVAAIGATVGCRTGEGLLRDEYEEELRIATALLIELDEKWLAERKAYLRG